MASTTEDAEQHLIMLAVQYLVAGRSSAICQLVPVSGNLLHHAVELILKALLVRGVGLRGVFKLGHSLPKIWDAVIAQHPQLDSPERKQTIDELDQFERLRYPDNMLKSGAAIRFGWDRGPKMATMTVPAYELVMSDIDELFRAGFRMTGKNPAFFVVMLNKEARAILGDRNNYPWIN